MGLSNDNTHQGYISIDRSVPIIRWSNGVCLPSRWMESTILAGGRSDKRNRHMGYKIMGENLMVGSHKGSNKKWRDGWERTFHNKEHKCTQEKEDDSGKSSTDNEAQKGSDKLAE